MKSYFLFEILHQSKHSKARVGRIHTSHGIIDTPNFVAVGTNGTIKTLDNQMVRSIGLQLMFCNTYHLLVQPGMDIIQKAGGLHHFIQRDLPIITDSGGFQVFSLAYGSVAHELKSCGCKRKDKTVLKIDEEGVIFRSYRDGQRIILTPESSIIAQKAMGADIIIPFDELLPYHTTHEQLKKSLERTHRWEQRSLKVHLDNPCHQAMYGVIHGGVDFASRKESCNFLTGLAFDGFAIGGSLGKTKKEMTEVVEFTTSCLPKEKPLHLLGIGDLSSLKKVIRFGVDTFDSSYPTRAARHGVALTEGGFLKILKGEYREDFSPLEKGCSCWTCTHYHRAYLHHLFKAKELSALSLMTIHNLTFMVNLMKEIREKILSDEI